MLFGIARLDQSDKGQEEDFIQTYPVRYASAMNEIWGDHPWQQRKLCHTCIPTTLELVAHHFPGAVSQPALRCILRRGILYILEITVYIVTPPYERLLPCLLPQGYQ